MPPKVVKPISESVEKEEVQAKKPPVKKTSTVTVKTPAAAKKPQTTQDKSSNSAVDSRVKLPTGAKMPVKMITVSVTDPKPKAIVAPVRKSRATTSLVNPIENMRIELENANLNESLIDRTGVKDPNDIAIGKRVSATIANCQFDNETLTKIRSLGSGAQGSVYLVDAGHFTKVAYKLVDGDLSSKNARELRMLLKFYDFVKQSPTSSKVVGFLMEYVEGTNLQKVILNKRKNYGLPIVLRWSREASGALLYLHQKQIIHRDVKPLNMLLTTDERLKLCDFGLAKGFSQNNTSCLGSYSYMAPEVIEPGPERYDEKCDVYSLAMSVWQIIARKDPHEEFRSSYALMQGTLTGFRPSADEIKDQDVRNIVVRAWDQDPKLRPTMAEVHQFFTNKIA